MTEGDEVTVLAMPAGMVAGLPDGERRFVLSLVGETVLVSEATEDYVEVEATDPADGMIHFLRMAACDLSPLAQTAHPH